MAPQNFMYALSGWAQLPIGAADYLTLTFNPLKLAALVTWVYLCLYCIERTEYGTFISNRHKGVANLTNLFIGPVLLLIIGVRNTVRRYSKSEVGLVSFIKQDIARVIDGLKSSRITGARGKSSIMLFDSAGKSLAEIYGHGGDKRVGQNTLKLTTRIIWDAISSNASDILIDPVDTSNFSVRYRIDGLLNTVDNLESDTCNAVISSIKAVAGMNIAERRRPQDGGFTAKTPDGTVAFRCATAGVLNGEKMSIRVLNQISGILSLDQIGLNQKQYKILQEAIASPAGTILVCGPTGSGKTTTIYGLLTSIDFFSRNVITVEDPIEYVLPNASQIEVNPKAGITFARALRSIFRQDPDVICVGEIRDQETAAIALQASQTGHLVLASVHSSSHASALVRLLDLGITRLTLSSAVNILVAQRLVRKLCENCKAPAALSETQMDYFRKQNANTDNVCEAVGCEECNYTGYHGRTGIFDIMVMDEHLKKLIVSEKLSAVDLKKRAEARGRSQLRREGIKKVLAGMTTVAEVKRVTADL